MAPLGLNSSRQASSRQHVPRARAANCQSNVVVENHFEHLVCGQVEGLRGVLPEVPHKQLQLPPITLSGGFTLGRAPPITSLHNAEKDWLGLASIPMTFCKRLGLDSCNEQSCIAR